jgi:hypothetical protein
VTVACVGVPPLALAIAGTTHPGSLTPASADSWRDLHVWLLPVFPLLGLGPWLVVHQLGPVLRWVTGLLGYVFAAFYTALDVLAGVGAGAAEASGTGELAVATLFHEADVLAAIGVRAYLVATVIAAAAAVLVVARAGRRTRRAPAVPWIAGLAAAAIVVGAAVSFVDSHIFWPRGVLTMAALAVGWSGLAWLTAGAPAAARSAR